MMHRLPRWLAFGFLVAGMLTVLSSSPGCNDPAPTEDIEQLVKDKVANHGRSVEILQGIKDKKDMNAALPMLLQNARRERELSSRISKLDRSAVEAFGEDYAKELQAAVDEQTKELARIRRLPGGEAFVLQLESLPRLETPLID